MTTFSDTTRKTVLAILVAPLSVLPAMLVSITVFIIFNREMSYDVVEIYQGGLLAAAIGTAISYAATLCYGLPVYWLLKKINENNAFSMALVSVIPSVIFAVINNDPRQWFIFLAMAYFSVIASLSFWYIANR